MIRGLSIQYENTYAKNESKANSITVRGKEKKKNECEL